MPKDSGAVPKKHKMMIVSVRPYCLPDPNGPKYKQYYQQKLILHVSFQHVNQLKGNCEKFSDAYYIFLQSADIPTSLENDIQRLTEHQLKEVEEDINEVLNVVSCVFSCQFFSLCIGT